MKRSIRLGGALSVVTLAISASAAATSHPVEPPSAGWAERDLPPVSQPFFTPAMPEPLWQARPTPPPDLTTTPSATPTPSGTPAPTPSRSTAGTPAPTRPSARTPEPTRSTAKPAPEPTKPTRKPKDTPAAQPAPVRLAPVTALGSQATIDRKKLVTWMTRPTCLLAGHDYAGWDWIDDLAQGTIIRVTTGPCAGRYRVVGRKWHARKGGPVPFWMSRFDLVLQTCTGASGTGFSVAQRL